MDGRNGGNISQSFFGKAFTTTAGIIVTLVLNCLSAKLALSFPAFVIQFIELFRSVATIRVVYRNEARRTRPGSTFPDL